MESKSQKENTERVAEEYLSSLSDLTCNSKPLINMLTMLAEENIEYAAIIVKVVEQHIAKVQPHFKLPILYLIDSIVKNVKSAYVQLFSHCIVGIFCGVFEKVNETVRERMYALRQTWNEVFSAQKLYALDVKVKRIDTNWPITAKQAQPSIHVNPNFLKTVNAAQTIPSDMEEVLHAKTRELLELKKRKLELELEATKKYLEEQEKQLSKATDSVATPPVEASSTLPPGAVRTQHLPPQAMPGSMVPPQHRMHPGAPVGIRPAMYNHNFRNPRPQMIAPAGMMNMPPQGYQAMPNAGKAKVHPVNPALLNTVRHRDPRLARQQHQQQQEQQHQQQQQMQIIQNRGGGQMFSVRNASSAPTDASKAEGKSNYRSSSSKSSRGGGGSGGSGSESKSPTRHSSSSSSRSAGRSGSSKNSSSNRDKDKDRKRSESKSSTTSSSSAGSNSERRKAGASSMQREAKPETVAIKCDKDAFEIAPLSSAFKRKSSSPASSPSSRDSKRSSKSRNYPRSNKNRSRSPSPLDIKDVDLRNLPTVSSSSASASPDKRVKHSDSDHEKEEHKPSVPSLTPATAASTSTNASKDLDKNLKIVLESPALLLPSLSSSMMDIDLRQFPSSSSTSLSNQLALVVNPAKPTTIQRAKNTIATTTTSSPKVSFKIEKLFNKLEKSTENLSTASSSAAADVADDVKATIDNKTSSNNNNNVDIKPEDSVSSGGRQSTSRKASSGETSMVVDGADEDGKKRPLISPSQEEDQPLAKKSKSAKLDALFGSEDVDLRTVMPPQILSVSSQKQTSSGIMTPPPPVISSEEESSAQQNVENWDNVKTSPSKEPPKKSSSLDDVRAKLAKTAKYNKFGKFEKSNKELSQRFKLSELNMNEDTQEANDEKIRTIITQAQELLDSNSINQDQYKNLVQTVMSINETNKLKEAKRRESLNNNHASSKTKQALSDEEASIEAERSAAREAILKKRIPKLAKKDGSKSVDSPLSDGNNANSADSPRYDSNEDSNDVPKPKSAKEKKRLKSSKWDTANPANMANNMNMQRPWMSGKRSGGDGAAGVGFRGTIPHPPLPPLPNPNLRLQLPWQMRAGMPPPPFANSMPIMQRGNVPPPPQPPMGMPPSVAVVPAVPAIPKPCNSIDNPQADLVRTITIDGMAKEIRIYDQVAIVFMELDQPREIGFQAGQRSIIIDNQEPISLQFNDEYKPIVIEGEAHRVRFGFPSRELYIDEHWYEIYFGGPPVSIPIKNKIHILKAEGPPPQVNIGPLRRDLVVGKINMIVDAHIIVPLFLDARVQTFRLGDKEHSIQFADNLLTVLLNGDVINVVYGGLPKSLTLGDIKYFIRFGALPHGIVAGKVRIKDMLYLKTEPLPELKPETSEMSDTQNVPAIAEPKPESDSATKEVSTTGSDGASTSSASSTIPVMPAAVLNNMNIDELFQKLVSSGILGGTTKVAATVAPIISTPVNKTTVTPITEPTATKNSAPEEPPQDPIRPINLKRSETIKSRQASIVATLFTGMQCSSCGVRFPPEQTIKYSQHLDWHFRQNRRERHSSRKAHSRNWYYDLNDWVQYEEVEDLDEREKNFFESQQNDFESLDDASNQRSTNSPVLSCPAGPDDVDRICDMCQEKFEQFYNEELEEWHLRSALRIEDKIYHPLCYEDYKASLNPPKPEEDKMKDQELINGEDDNAMDIIIKIEGDEKAEDDEKASMTIVDDEDDDVIVLPNDEPSVTEIDDDEDEYIPLNVTREEMGVVSTDEAKVASEDGVMNETTESDVEIQEPNIPFTDLDTYEEKELPECDEASQMSFMNLKIKEEPKEDEDEDDGFEDVGTVVILPDEEISIQSSEETQTQTIASSTSVASPSAERPPSVASQHDPTDITAPETAAAIVDLNVSMEPEDEHNLSTAGPAPAIPMASLVNKIKINITKNNVSTNSSSTSASTTTTTTTATTSNSLNCNSNELNRGSLGQQSTIATVSTIPVLCGGGSTGSSIVSHVTTANSGENGSGSASGSAGGVNVSSISVIGSYGSGSSSSNTSRYHHQHAPPAAAAPAVPRKAPTPPPIEDTITYEQKATLQKAALKKTKKKECGIETSGLCSIM